MMSHLLQCTSCLLFGHVTSEALKPAICRLQRDAEEMVVNVVIDARQAVQVLHGAEFYGTQHVWIDAQRSMC